MARKQKQMAISLVDARNMYYLAGDPRRRKEFRDSQFIGNDQTEIQNVPQQAKIEYVPSRPFYTMASAIEAGHEE